MERINRLHFNTVKYYYIFTTLFWISIFGKCFSTSFLGFIQDMKAYYSHFKYTSYYQSSQKKTKIGTFIQKIWILQHHTGILSTRIQFWKNVGASRFTCKELGSHHSILRSKQLNKLKNQQLFLDLWESWGHRANHFPQNWRNRLANTGSHGLLKQKTTETSVEVGKPQG